MARVRVWLTEAWDLVGADLPVFTLAAFVTISLSLLTLFILTMPLLAGMCIMFSEKLQGHKPELSHLWEGVTTRFPAAIVVWIMYMLAVIPFDGLNVYLRSLGHLWPQLGLVSIFVGHFVVATPLFFCAPLIADRDVSALEALRLSWGQVRPRWGGILLCCVVFTLMLAVGVIAFLVGIILTLPVVVGAQMLAYSELFREVEVTKMIPIKEPSGSEEADDVSD
jgi:uncharacterized membrane protein